MDLDSLLGSMHDYMRRNNEFKELIPDLERLRTHKKDPVRLLIMGEFSVGKSTLINALLKEDVIDNGAVPTTAIATFLRYSEDTYFEVVLNNGAIECHTIDQLAEFSSERAINGKEKRKNIHHINLYLPNPNLKDIVLIDTPGLNSVNEHHNEQAFKAYEEADDSLWIFKYGAVGRSTEYQMLNKLLEIGLHPIGVINMIDESDEDNLDPYLQYESKKLGRRIRNLIGVSAKEAQEAYEEQDDELLDLSNFQQLQSILEDAKNDQARKQMRFERRLTKFYDELTDTFNQVIKSEDYQNHLNILHHFLLDVSEKNKTYLKDLAHLEEERHAVQENLEEKLNKTISLKDWITCKDFKELIVRFPELQEWKDLNSLYHKITKDVHSYKKDLASYSYELSKVAEGKSTDHRTLRNCRLIKKELSNRRKQIKKEIKMMNILRFNILEQKGQLVTKIEEYYQSLALKKYTSIHTQLEMIKEKAEKEILDDSIAFEELSKSYSQLNHFKDLIVQIPNFVNSSINNSKLQVVAHVEKETEIREELEKFNRQILITPNSLSTEELEINVRVELPEHIEPLDEVPNHFMLSITKFTPFRVLTGILAFNLALHLASQYYENDSRYQDDTYAPELASTDRFNSEDEILIPKVIDNREAVGTIMIDDQEINVFEKSSDQYEKSNYILTAHTTWEVYSETDYFYEIQDGYWVSKEDVLSFSSYLIEYIQPEMDGIATISSDSEEVYVYKEANAESEKVNILGNQPYQVSAFTENGWIQIGDDAWVKYDQSIALNQQIMKDKIRVKYSNGYGILRTEETTSDFIPIFEEDNWNSAVIGYLEDTQYVDIYELPNRQWGKIGTNAWIQADKYLNVNWDFTPKKDDYPIGTLIVETDVLNVRQRDHVESNLLGTLKKGNELEVYAISSSTGWYRIGKEGWVSVDSNYSTFLSHYKTYPTGEPIIGQAKIVAHKINVRDSEHPDSDKLGILNQDEIVHVYEISDETGWYRIGDNEWISNNDSLVSYEAYELEEF